MYRRRTDGIYVVNLEKTWEKLQLAARVIVAIENPQVGTGAGGGGGAPSRGWGPAAAASEGAKPCAALGPARRMGCGCGPQLRRARPPERGSRKLPWGGGLDGTSPKH